MTDLWRLCERLDTRSGPIVQWHRSHQRGWMEARMPAHGRCFYCALPVRFGDDCAHPGHGVIDYVAGVTSLDLLGLPNLRLLHEFCRNQLRSRTNRSQLRQGLAIRRARLGRATEAFEAGLPVA